MVTAAVGSTSWDTRTAEPVSWGALAGRVLAGRVCRDMLARGPICR